MFQQIRPTLQPALHPGESALVPTALYTNRKKKICKGDQTQKRRRSCPDVIQWDSNRQEGTASRHAPDILPSWIHL